MNARIVIGGFIVAHLVSVIFYFPERIARRLEGAAQPVRGAVVVRRLPGRVPRFSLLHEEGRDPPAALRRFGRARAVGGLDLRAHRLLHRARPPGPPRHASFFLSVAYPDGPRIDLGLYELLFTIVLTAILFALQPQAAAARPHHRARGADVRARALPARFPARDRRGPPRRALRRADARAVGLPGDRRARRLPLAPPRAARAARRPRPSPNRRAARRAPASAYAER